MTPSFTCPICSMTSYNVHDITHGYCGNCHEFTGKGLWPDLYTIYDHPKDYPQGFVCVLYRGTRRVRVCGYAETLEGVRVFVPEGLTNIHRFMDDDQAIAEVWI